MAVVSGYYSERMATMIRLKAKRLGLDLLTTISYEQFLAEDLPACDWVVACYTETADAFKADLPAVKGIAERLGARLMIDATGSINLEADHELADVAMFSSCKGLGGLTGAGFITFNKELLAHLNGCEKEFILDLETYIEKKTTSPAHTLLSMDSISSRFAELGERVATGKRIFMERYKDKLFRPGNQPNLCTKVNMPI